jgi:hypothetical protein
MIDYIHNVISHDDCQKIIDIAEGLPKWNRVYQGYSPVDIIKCYIKPHISEILDRLEMDIPENCSVEVLKYRTGSENGIHKDGEGDHTLSQTSTIHAEWKQTGVVLLNDDFTGGELFFPNMAIAFGNNSKGNLVLFTAGNNPDSLAHGVNKVYNGTRYTLVFRYI